MPANTMSKQPVAIITGAGSGIGRAICVLLAKEGWRVALAGRNRSPLEETIEHIHAGPDHALVVTTDVTHPREVTHLVEEVASRFGRIDALVNNAGAVESSPIPEMTQEHLKHMFAVNTFGPAHLIARVWPVMARQGSGCIVNVSSMSAVDPFPGLAFYGAAKSALHGLTCGIVNEGGPHNIRGFTVAPGAVETPMLRGLVSEDELPPSAVLKPNDVAQVVVECILGRRDEDIGRLIQVA